MYIYTYYKKAKEIYVYRGYNKVIELCNSAITRGETIHSRFIQWVLKSSFIFIKFVSSNRYSEKPMLYMSNIALFGEILIIVSVYKFQEYCS